MKITLTHLEMILLQEVNHKQVEVETKTSKQIELKKLEEVGLLQEQLYPKDGKYIHSYSISGLGRQVLKEHLPYREDNRDAQTHAQ